jgi:hypothetical protein
MRFVTSNLPPKHAVGRAVGTALFRSLLSHTRKAGPPVYEKPSFCI